MFYRRPLDRPLYLPALALLVSLDSPDFGPVILRGRGKRTKKKEKEKTPVCPPLPSPPRPPLFFVITKEQTHIKHTQGAEAVIAVSAVLLWVAGDDNISHRSIYIIFLIMSSLNHGHLEAGSIPEIFFAYDKHDTAPPCPPFPLCTTTYHVFRIWEEAEYSSSAFCLHLSDPQLNIYLTASLSRYQN